MCVHSCFIGVYVASAIAYIKLSLIFCLKFRFVPCSVLDYMEYQSQYLIHETRRQAEFYFRMLSDASLYQHGYLVICFL